MTTAVYSAIQQARLSMLLATAEGDYLNTIGQNNGVPRSELITDEEMYRRVIPVLGWQPKMILFTTYALLTAIFGSQADIVTAGARPWRVYEVNANEIIIEIPLSLIGSTNENASYLHGASGYGFVVAGPIDTFVTPGDISDSSATTLVGKDLHFNTSSGTWTDYTILAFSYSAITDLSTVQVSAATLPTGGGFFYLEIPGDGVDSYRGDYLASGGLVTTFSTAAGPPTTTIALRGDATQHIDVDDAVLVYDGATVISTSVATVGAYDPATNLTAATIADAVPGGLVNAAFVRLLEAADTPTTPPHDDRVYLTGLGLYEVFKFYFDLLVRAAGIVVRLELI